MNTIDFVAELGRQDIQVWADGDRLQCDAPDEALTPELANQLLLRKSEILKFLRGPAELSFSQQRLWFLEHLDPEGATYVIYATLELRGALDTSVLERVLGTLVARHDSLRTLFVNVEGRPLQIVSKPGPWNLHVTDLSNEEDALRRLGKLLREESSRGFDLERGPLFRARLYRLADDAHVLLLTMHHIVSDGWSMAILTRELTELYTRLSRGQATKLPELHPQYRDFARWQRDRLQGEELSTLLAHWQSRLAGAPQILELPTDRPRPPQESYCGANYTFALPSKFVNTLRGFSRREDVTPFMTLLTGFTVLLSRYSGQEDFLVGMPVANRNRTEIEGLVGFFVNTLLLRVQLSGDPTVRQHLACMREVCLDAYAHQDLPYDQLVEALHPERDMSRNPVFQVVFVQQPAAQEPLELPGLAFKPIAVDNGTAKFDLTLDVQETPKGLDVVFNYATDLFDKSTIARMATHWRALLEGMIATPECRVSDLALLSAAERGQLLGSWSGDETAYPRELSLQALFEEQVTRHPDAVAVEYGKERLSYAELNARANQLAHYLAHHGVGPEVMVGLCVERSLDMVVGIMGIVKAGGVYVPLDPNYPGARLAMMFEDTDAAVLLTESWLRDRLPAFAGKLVCLDDDGDSVPIARESASNPPVKAGARNLAYVMYTSGSTGRPKGTCIEQRSVVRLVKNTNYLELGPQDVFLQHSPISFDASTFELWGSLLNGAKLVVCPAGQLSMEELGKVIRDKGITTLWLTAGLFNLMVDEQLDSLRVVRQLLAGGEALSVTHVRRVLDGIGNGRLINGYGPTENTTFSCCHVMDAHSHIGQSTPIGRPISNTRVYILDAQGQPVPIGVAGELYVGGDGLAREYLNQPELTAEKFVVDPFSRKTGARLYRTGDWVRYLPDGNIQFLGRIDHQVKIRGFRIELGEIETELSQHPAVREVVVLAREDDPGDRRVVAYVVAENAPADLIEQFRIQLRANLPEYMVPVHFVSLDKFPLTANGKIDRKTLPAPERLGTDEEAYVAPRNATEKILADIWAEVLKLARVGVVDNFFELGGHSLLATQVVSRLRRVLGVEIALRELFGFPTIAGLSARIEVLRQQAGKSIKIDEITPQSSASRPPGLTGNREETTL